MKRSQIYNGYISGFHSSYPLGHFTHQSPSFKGDHRATKDLRRRTETTPVKVKDSLTRIKPVALTNGHGCHITVTDTCFRWGMAVVRYNLYKFETVSIPKRPCTAVSLLKPPCGGFRSEAATWIQKPFKISTGTSRKPYHRHNGFLRRRRRAWL